VRFLLLALCVIAAAWLIWSSIDPGMIVDSVICPTVKELPSPQNDYVASVSECDGGATTSYASRVSVRTSRERGTYSRDQVVFGYDGSAAGIEVEWVGPRELLIRHPLNPIFKQVSERAGVRITYGSRTPGTGSRTDRRVQSPEGTFLPARQTNSR